MASIGLNSDSNLATLCTATFQLLFTSVSGPPFILKPVIVDGIHNNFGEIIVTLRFVGLYFWRPHSFIYLLSESEFNFCITISLSTGALLRLWPHSESTQPSRPAQHHIVPRPK